MADLPISPCRTRRWTERSPGITSPSHLPPDLGLLNSQSRRNPHLPALPDVAFFFPDRHRARFGSSPSTFSLAIDETFINGRPPDLGLLNSTAPKTLVWQHFPISASCLRTVNRRPSVALERSIWVFSHHPMVHPGPSIDDPLFPISASYLMDG